MAPGAGLRLTVESLDLRDPGTLDLGDNPLTIEYTGPSPANLIRIYIARAYAGGAWTGSGLTSALADADRHGIGYADLAGATLVARLTRYGDANLDQAVDIVDFNALAANFGTTGGAVWSQGDFNYDGIVNIRDFNRLAANFGITAAGPDVTSRDWATLASAVPEPTGLATASAVAAALGLRTRGRIRGRRI